MSIPYPEAALPNPDPIELIQPEIDEIADRIANLGTGDKFPDEFNDDAFNWAAMIRNDLPDCCAMHRVDALASVQYQAFMVINICEATSCPEVENHRFVMEMVRIIGEVGRKLALKGHASSRRN